MHPISDESEAVNLVIFDCSLNLFVLPIHVYYQFSEFVYRYFYHFKSIDALNFQLFSMTYLLILIILPFDPLFCHSKGF